MADTVDSVVLVSDPKRYVVRITNVSDGTGESAVVKIDRSALTGPDGLEPKRLKILSLRWCIQGFSSVRLFFDAATDDEIAVLCLNGYENYARWGGGLQDPLSTTNVGDVILTTAGAISGATYDITIEAGLSGR